MVSQKRLLGVISDTHGLLESRVVALFQGVEQILHAGDIGSAAVYHGLQGIAPVTAVLGNVDCSADLPGLGLEQTVELDGVRIWMTHILGDPHRLSPLQRQQLAKQEPQVAVFGHTHQPFQERLGGILFFNPGSAGRKRFHLPRTVGFLEIEHGQIHSRIVEL